MSVTKINIDLGTGHSIEIETGKIANLANGACTVRQGDTIVLVTACSGPARTGIDFFPLQVDYRERYSAAGRFPGGYIKREGRPSDKEILTCRVTDRPIRPLFPEGYFDEVMIQALLLSADGDSNPDVLCMLGASVALCLSELPFQGPIGAVRLGYVDGKFIVNPTHSEMKKSSLELIYAGVADKVIMIEGEAKECPDELLKEAMIFANEVVKKQIAAQNDLAAKAGKPKKTPKLYLIPEKITTSLSNFASAKLEKVCMIEGKEDRSMALASLRDEAVELIAYENPDDDKNEITINVKRAFDDMVKKTIRTSILEKSKRPDGRGLKDLRKISAEVGVLPIVHGSGLFTRGETQALVITTLGGPKDTQESDDISGGDNKKKFYLHYNFPNFSTGEVGRISGPGRREIGHGNLAERSVAQVIPEDFPYTIRCVSEVMSSNGSTSMASVCGAILSLMDAGVPIKAPVAGISCGLITGDDNKEVLLTDIIGAEDHFGDMDFKVCGTRNGVTGFQLDLKLPGVSIDLLCRGMAQIKETRLNILDVIEACLPAPRPEISKNAPQMETMRINPGKIGALIGPGGKKIKEITEATGASIEIEDSGEVKILARDRVALDNAKNRILEVTAEAEIGKIYRGKVVALKDFGAFIEIFPGQEGLLHISEMANYRVNQVSDICKEGDFVSVKVIDVDNSGKIRLSRKAALVEMQ